MDKGTPSSLFANDGSFMERFKQLHQNETETAKALVLEEPNSKPGALVAPLSKPVNMKFGNNNKTKAGIIASAPSGSKLAFSLKQKSKILAPVVKLGEDEDEDEEERGASSPPLDGAAKRQKLGYLEDHNKPSGLLEGGKLSVIPPPAPSDPTVKNVADKLASFVAKNGRNFEYVTRQRNLGDTPFKFLFDKSCADYKYYEYQLQQEEKILEKANDSDISKSGSVNSSTAWVSQSSVKQKPLNYQIPTSALYDSSETNLDHTESIRSGNSSSSSGMDPIAMMEYYMKKAAQEEKKKQPKQSPNEMPPPASLQDSGKKGHHMGDYIPPEELDKFLASCNDAAARKAAKEAAERAKIQADNVGHKLLSKMGWKEGEGLGGSRKGIANPIMAGDVKQNNLGVGAQNPGEVRPDDDIYEQYKKRMMLGYRYRPNPLNNPRKAYY